MSDRSFHGKHTQGVKYVDLCAAITLASGSPIFVEGDTASAIAGSYLTLTDTGTGRIGVATKDAYPGLVGVQLTVAPASANANLLVNATKPSQNATTNKWSFEIRTWTNAAGTISAADMTDGDIVYLTLTLRDSKVKP